MTEPLPDQPSDTDRSTAGDWVRFPMDRPRHEYEVEDYQDLGHTFLGGAGNYHPYAQVLEVIEEVEPDPPLLNLFPMICWAIVASLVVLALLAADLYRHAVHGIHSANAHASAGTFHHAGGALEILIVVALIYGALRLIGWLLKG